MSHMQQIPLKLLKVSPRNVRKTASGIDALAVSIAAHGLVHNLVAEKVNGHFEVIAGSRRLLALQQLEKKGDLPDEFKEGIRTLVVPEAGAAEISLAENAMREPMHPADQFEAFRALLEAGEAEVAVAARFSVTALFVRQRMKLASVSPKILDQYRAGKLDLDCVEAFALSDDHADQERVLKALRYPRAYSIREALTKSEIALTDKRIKAIGGVEAYEKAGGAVRRDLFESRGTGYAVDAKLVNQLLDQAFATRVKKLEAEGWGFVDAGADIDQYRYPALQKDAKGIADKAKAGAIVFLDWNGEIKTVRGVLKPGSKVKADGKVQSPAAKSKKPGELTFAATQRLQAEANAALQVHVAESPRTALALLLQQLVRHDFYPVKGYGDNWERQKVVHVAREGTGRLYGPAREAMEKTAAGVAVAGQVKAWREKLPKAYDEFLPWAMGQEYSTLGHLLAVVVARELETMQLHSGAKEKLRPMVAAIGAPLDKLWKPTNEWLATLPKSAVVELVRDAAGKEKAAPLEKLARPQLPAAALPLFPAGWLPSPLRQKPPVKVVGKKLATRAKAKK